MSGSINDHGSRNINGECNFVSDSDNISAHASRGKSTGNLRNASKLIPANGSRKCELEIALQWKRLENLIKIRS